MAHMHSRWGLLASSLGLLSCFAVAACDRPVQIPAGLSWDSPVDLDFIHQSRLVITNNGDDTLSIASDDTLTQPKLLGTIEVGNNPIELEGPHHLKVSPDGKYIYYNLSNYVTNGGSGPHGAHGTGMVPGYLVKLDARTGRSLSQVLIDRSPGDVILSKDGRIAYVSHYDLARLMDQVAHGKPAEQGYSSIAIIDTETMQLLSMTSVAPTLHGMGLSADGKSLYVTCSLSDELAILDVSQPSAPVITKKIPVGTNPGTAGNATYAPYALTVAQDGTVWISDNNSGDVRIYDPATGQMDVNPVKLGGIVMFSTFSSDGSKLYVARQNDDHLFEIDKATRATRDLPLPPAACLAAHAVSLLPGGNGLVVVCEGDHLKVKGTLVYVDLPTFTMKGQLSLGLFSDGVEVMPALP